MTAKRKRKPPTGEVQPDLFIVPLRDIRFRDEQETMVLPFLSLSKRKRNKPIEYTHEKTGNTVRVTALEETGIATIWDFDLIIWAMSTIREMHDRQQPVSTTLEFAPYDYWRAVRVEWNSIGGHDYDRLEDTINRLKGTQIKTNLRSGPVKDTISFNWIEYAEVRRDEETGRIERIRIQLPKWLVDGVLNDQLVLTIDPDYLLLTGGLDRWLYRFVRKSVGYTTRWIPFRMETLHGRSGSSQPGRQFAFDMRELVDSYDPESKANTGKPRGEVPVFPGYRLKHYKQDGVEYLAVRAIETIQPLAHIRPGEAAARYKAGFLAVSDDVRDQARGMCKESGTDENTLYEAWKQRNIGRLNNPDAEPLKAPGRAYLGYVRRALARLKTTG